MANGGKYSVLFEPVKIGPVTARNRFYQVPHCCGLGHLRPRAHAAMRAMKAEGGWAVVSTEEAELHPSSDLSPYPEQRIWDDHDIPALRLMTEAVHDKGSLAAIELVHNGNHSANLLSRAPVLAPSDMSVDLIYPKQARAMDKSDIRAFRRWHKDAALRAKRAGFDIVYVYAGHRMTLAHHFLLKEYNDRTDEYGGSLENRARLMRELLEETKEAIGGECAVALRFAVDEMMGPSGMQASAEGREVVEMLAEIPDLWDVNVSDWSNDSATTRFQPEDGYQTTYIDFVKKLTSKPVVAVGRLNSPDMMASMVKNGIVDFIGAARPSIADPFLPAKIKDDRIEEIRECIGCNICVSCDSFGIPIRCTQNPTMGEEWRRNWHPEKIQTKGREQDVLVVGGGPAGLECAMQLARRGYEVTLAEAEDQLGGRVLHEAALPGLGAWKRVADHRTYDLSQRGNVQVFLDSKLDASHIGELAIRNIFVATGSSWRRDGVGRTSRAPLEISDGASVFTPDDIMTGNLPTSGPVVIYDDDQAYLAGVIAEHLAVLGRKVCFITPASMVSPWTQATLEQTRIQTSLLHKGVDIMPHKQLKTITAGSCEVACTFTGQAEMLACEAVVLVTERQRHTRLFDELQQAGADGFKPATLELIGDAAAPGLIADAVYSGHMAARNFEQDPAEIAAALFRRELTALSGT
jgi:dimethylamine/trimethylamine dehydrogenase